MLPPQQVKPSRPELGAVRMRRVMVIGTSCSGKTTLARQISDVLDVPHVELDVLHWGPNWTERPLDDFREAVAAHVSEERWVVDGNYGKVRDIVLARATDAVWLNYPFRIVLGRALARTCRRVVTREELFGGNRETFRSAFLSRYSIPWWVVRTHRWRRRQYRELFSVGEGSRVRLVELRHPRDADELIERLMGNRRLMQ